MFHRVFRNLPVCLCALAVILMIHPRSMQYFWAQPVPLEERIPSHATFFDFNQIGIGNFFAPATAMFTVIWLCAEILTARWLRRERTTILPFDRYAVSAVTVLLGGLSCAGSWFVFRMGYHPIHFPNLTFGIALLLTLALPLQLAVIWWEYRARQGGL